MRGQRDDRGADAVAAFFLADVIVLASKTNKIEFQEISEIIKSHHLKQNEEKWTAAWHGVAGESCVPGNP